MYLLDHNILAHPRFLHFYVPTRPYYSCAPLIPPFLRFYSTITFLLTRDTSISMYLLDKILLRFLDSSIFTYLLDHHAKWCNVCECLRYLVLCYPWRYKQSLEILMVWLHWFSVWLAMFFGLIHVVSWLIHHHIRPPLWNAKGFEQELLLVSFLRVATLSMTQVSFRRLDGLTRSCYHHDSDLDLQKFYLKLFISSDIQCSIAWFVGFWIAALHYTVALHTQ